MQEYFNTIDDLNNFIERLKLFLDAKSDSELSKKLNRKTNYIAQCKQRKTIDLEIVLNKCFPADFNWLITGKSDKSRLVAIIDEKIGRKIVDLNEVHEKLIIENKKLEEQNEILMQAYKAKSN